MQRAPLPAEVRFSDQQDCVIGGKAILNCLLSEYKGSLWCVAASIKFRQRKRFLQVYGYGHLIQKGLFCHRVA